MRCIWLTALAVLFAAFPARGAELPPPSGEAVDFTRDVLPLLRERCGKCHAAGKRRGAFRIDTRETVLEGGESGVVVVAGKSAESRLIALVAGLDPDEVMPPKGERLSAEEVGVLRRWIDDGVAWKGAEDDGSAKGRLRPPRRPEVPDDPSLDHPIDRLLAPYFAEHGFEPPPVVDDRTFARRVWLDTIGILPEPAALEAFAADQRPGKRARLVRDLLSDSSRYAEHWLSFWNDALRNDYRGTGYIDGGRQQISAWLFRALAENRPYDRFVRELVHPTPESEGFVKGIVWRGTVNASQVPAMQAAQNVAQVFLGINLKCASCHDSFISDWKLEDAYALANVFADQPLEVHRCNQPTGEMAATRFLWPDIGEIDAKAARPQRLEQLAEALTSPRNGRFARTIVNRLWARFLGRGLIEPVDEMEREPWSRDLLDWLASDLVANGHDLKHTIERILLSRAYQLPSVGAEERATDDFVFRGPAVRRLSAEQFVDAVAKLTGATGELPAAFLDAMVASEVDAAAAGASGGDHGAEGSHGFVRFRSGLVREGAVEVDADLRGASTLWLVATSGDDGGNHDWANWAEPTLVGPAGEKRLTELRWRSVINGHGELRVDQNTVQKPLRVDRGEPTWGLGAHALSVIVYDLPPGYDRLRARVGPDQQAVDEGGASGHSVEFFVLTDVLVRSALTNSDALTRALGRPNREQVVTRRESAATTLQALELTNGRILDEMLRAGATRWLRRDDAAPAGVVTAIFSAALGRPPTPGELEAARGLVGDPATAEGVADLLWVTAMLPEFQLIH